MDIERLQQLSRISDFSLQGILRGVLRSRLQGAERRLVGDPPRRHPQHLQKLGLPDQTADLQRFPLRAGRMKNGNRSHDVVGGTPPYTVRRSRQQMVRDVQITPVVSDITEPFALPPVASPTLVAFLGSTIGNFPREQAIQLLSHIASEMAPADRFLLGADLIKDAEIINRAYNDSRAVTAAFNLNVLERLNRELNADFPVSDYEHRAFYSSENHRVEMHLIARRAHKVVIPEIGEISLEKGESIRTELSYKYDRPMLEDILSASGLTIEKWMPADDGSFALALARVEG